MPPSRLMLHSQSLDDHIVGFGNAGSEDDLLCTSIGQTGCLSAGIFYRVAGLIAPLVEGNWVAEPVLKMR